MKKIVTLAALFGLSLASNAYAADCIIHYNRTACPGQEAESYSKCDGKKECDKADAAPTEIACLAAAAAACDNSRLEITKSKVITAKYQGKPLKDGANFCAADRPDFNKCSK